MRFTIQLAMITLLLGSLLACGSDPVEPVEQKPSATRTVNKALTEPILIDAFFSGPVTVTDNDAGNDFAFFEGDGPIGNRRELIVRDANGLGGSVSATVDIELQTLEFHNICSTHKRLLPCSLQNYSPDFWIIGNRIKRE